MRQVRKWWQAGAELGCVRIWVDMDDDVPLRWCGPAVRGACNLKDPKICGVHNHYVYTGTKAANLI